MNVIVTISRVEVPNCNLNLNLSYYCKFVNVYSSVPKLFVHMTSKRIHLTVWYRKEAEALLVRHILCAFKNGFWHLFLGKSGIMVMLPVSYFGCVIFSTVLLSFEGTQHSPGRAQAIRGPHR